MRSQNSDVYTQVYSGADLENSLRVNHRKQVNITKQRYLDIHRTACSFKRAAKGGVCVGEESRSLKIGIFLYLTTAPASTPRNKSYR